MIAQELEVSLHMAFVEARQQRHEFITVEHLLLALIDNPSAAEALRSCGAKPDALRKDRIRLALGLAAALFRLGLGRDLDPLLLHLLRNDLLFGELGGFLIALGERLSLAFHRRYEGAMRPVLWETATGAEPEGLRWAGYTDNYISVAAWRSARH